ncbi:MAG: MATE family efflux transporter [Eubacteriales bacterium]|nr:MATE family efflux transporter [Eubacteriales bacterium]
MEYSFDKRFKSEIENRNTRLLGRIYRKYLVPNMTSQLSLILITFFDSLVAARYIGIDAVQAIALLNPIIFIDFIFHDFFISGISTVITRYKGLGESGKAKRAFAAIVFHQFFGYLFMYGLIIAFIRPILSFFSVDPTLIADAIKYYIPYAMAIPFAKAAFCLERGFNTDGNSSFFAVRGVLTNVLNLIFNYVAVLAFKSGIMGLSVASSAAMLLSYGWSLSYYFNDKCTIRPDFSVIKNRKELRGYVQEEISIGRVFALDDSLYAVMGVLFNKLLISTGGLTALACNGIVLSIYAIYESLILPIQSSFSQITTFYYADGDIYGTRGILRLSVVVELVFGIVFVILAVLMNPLIGLVYKVTDSAVLQMMPFFLGCAGVTLIINYLSNMISAFAIATKRNRLADKFNVSNNLFVMAGLALGALVGGFKGMMLGRIIAAFLILCAETWVIGKSKVVFGEESEEELVACSYKLTESAMSEISERIYNIFHENSELKNYAVKASLLTEEYNRSLLYLNREKGNVTVDMRVLALDGNFSITIMDDGDTVDFIGRIKQSERPEVIELSEKILAGFSPDSSYSRVFDMNITHLIFPNKNEENIKHSYRRALPADMYIERHEGSIKRAARKADKLKKILVEKGVPEGNASFAVGILFPDYINSTIPRLIAENVCAAALILFKGRHDLSIGSIQMRPSTALDIERYAVGLGEEIYKPICHAADDTGRMACIRRSMRILNDETAAVYVYAFVKMVKEMTEENGYFKDRLLKAGSEGYEEELFKICAISYNGGHQDTESFYEEQLDIANYPYGMFSRMSHWNYTDMAYTLYKLQERDGKDGE